MILLFILVLILLNIYLKKNHNKIDLFPIIIVMLILYAGFKYNYSYDYNNYLIHFNEINSFADVISTGFEKGYSLIIFIFKNLGLGFHALLLFIAFISIKTKSKLIKQLSIFPEISLLIYFLLFYVNNDVEQIRHGISIAFCFYSLIHMLKNNNKSKVYSFLLIVLGILFHTSAILFIPVLFIKDKKISKKTYIIIFLISLALSYVNYFDLLTLLNNNFLHSLYLETKISLYARESNSLINASLLIKLFILIVFYHFSFNSKDKSHRLLFNIYYLGIILSNVFNSIPILAIRGTIYMRYAELLIIPLYIQTVINQRNKRYHYIILLLIFIYYFMKFFTLITNPEYFYYTSI
ncbi:MAG: EpsG family protein [Beduini sp.]|uniref:EpsG family protein n=1 Tax=Beduini sp. TaxID=1922300 RepID=UPI0039A07AF8